MKPLYESISSEWFPIENDVIGGWCVSTVNKPLSHWSREEQNHGLIICEGINEEALALYISTIHNLQSKRKIK